MKIDFDSAKDAANIAKHGISLARTAGFSAVAYITDDRHDYGEIRTRAYGYIDGVSYCVVFTVRGDTMRVISLRRARAKEMKRYAP